MPWSPADLAAPLSDVTFVVIDLETTGGSPLDCAITEVGAVKLRGGECLGTFGTLVNPGVAIPAEITYLTGITQAMLVPAPPIESVLPSLLEFIGSDAVIVGHNVRFDLAFLHQAMRRTDRGRLPHPVVDTCLLARRLVRDEVPNCKLATLSTHFRVGHQPTHRALDDALATGEVLHCLLERAGSLGVVALDDLLELPTVKGHPMVAKLKLAASLPRRTGVYLMRDAGGRVLYVGKAVDLRRRVRSYFAGEERRKVGQLLRETHAIDHIVCTGELEAAVLEVRMIHELRPRYNRQAKLWRRYAYLKLTLNERFPRLAVVRTPRDDGGLYLGPLPSTQSARLVAEAIESAVPIRRCTAKPATPARAGPCAPAQLGVATCPCAGQISADAYRELIERVVRGLTCEPEILLRPLGHRMRALAAARRFEEAADVRDRAAALARAISRQRRLDGLRRAGRITLGLAGGGGARVENGLLHSAWDASGGPGPDPPPLTPAAVDSPVPRELADELACVAAFLEAKAAHLTLVGCDGELASPLPRLPRFEPAERRRAG